MKKICLLLMCIVTIFLIGCGSEQEKVNNKILIVASFYPMADFVAAIGQDLVQVETLIADGVEPHDFEPTAKDLTKLGRAKLFVYNGGVEPWAKPALETVADKNVLSIEAGEGLFDEKAKHVDPHVWVSPKKALQEVRIITEALIKADPKNATIYQKNSEVYQQKLIALDQRLEKVSVNALQKVFVTTHAAFGHLASDYNLKQVPVMGISSEAEPTPADLKKLLTTIAANKVQYIFFETLASPRIIETIADESGAKILVLDPVEGLSETGRKNGDNYLSIMSRNIDNLELALEAK